jgi:uncharacterized protein
MEARMSRLVELGVGLGYRLELHDDTMRHRGELDFLEVITDDFMARADGLDALRRLREHFVLVPHGLEMSVGSEEPLDMQYLDAVARIADAVDAPWVSDHLCFTREADVQLGALTPVRRTRQRARHIAAKVRQAQDYLGRPFLLENIAYYLDLPSELTEIEMIHHVLEESGAGLLLDLNNVAVNARNHQFSASEFLRSMPLDRVVQVHLAGNTPHAEFEGLEIDSHDAPVSDEVFDLLRDLIQRCRPKAVMIERDARFPSDFAELIFELARVRSILAETPHGS